MLLWPSHRRLGVGYNPDKTDVGENGAEATPMLQRRNLEDFFLEDFIGGSSLDVESTRYVTTTGDFATGNRSGHQLFGSLTAAPSAA